jgi:predicted RNA-binding protein with PUA-like domain
MVDVAFVTKFASILPLQQIKAEPRLKGIMVAQQGSRLSVQPLSEEHFKVICAMAGRKKLP